MTLRFIRLVLLAFLPALFVTENSVAQVGIVVFSGQQRSLGVSPNEGDTYAWSIYNKPTFQPADLAGQTEVGYAAGESKPVLQVLWKKQGDFYYTVTAFNSKGCKNMKVGYVKVIAPPVTAVAGQDTTIGICSSFVLDASKSIGDGLTYHWDVLDPGGKLTPNNAVKTSISLASGYSGPLPLRLRILLTVTNKFKVSGSDTVNVTIGAPPKASIVCSATPNKDGSMLIDGCASNGQGLKYHWCSTEGQIVGEANKSMVLIKGAGIYSLEVTDQFGCKSTKIFQYPFEPNDLIANADYVRTSWVDSIRIHVLNNDFDSRNDIDKRTLSILQQPDFGTTHINLDGTINYSPNIRKAGVDHFIYQICDSANVCDSAKVTIDIFDGPVWISEAISVNGDGRNEFFVVRGLENYPNTTLNIYTRSGQLIYKSLDYHNDWSGRAMSSSINDGTVLPIGTYYYVLHLGGTNRYIKGFVYLTD
jgi:gliding motility-associated-like protein